MPIGKTIYQPVVGVLRGLEGVGLHWQFRGRARVCAMLDASADVCREMKSRFATRASVYGDELRGHWRHGQWGDVPRKHGKWIYDQWARGSGGGGRDWSGPGDFGGSSGGDLSGSEGGGSDGGSSRGGQSQSGSSRGGNPHSGQSYGGMGSGLGSQSRMSFGAADRIVVSVSSSVGGVEGSGLKGSGGRYGSAGANASQGRGASEGVNASGGLYGSVGLYGSGRTEAGSEASAFVEAPGVSRSHGAVGDDEGSFGGSFEGSVGVSEDPQGSSLSQSRELSLSDHVEDLIAKFQFGGPMAARLRAVRSSAELMALLDDVVIEFEGGSAQRPSSWADDGLGREGSEGSFDQGSFGQNGSFDQGSFGQNGSFGPDGSFGRGAFDDHGSQSFDPTGYVGFHDDQGRWQRHGSQAFDLTGSEFSLEPGTLEGAQELEARMRRIEALMNELETADGERGSDGTLSGVGGYKGGEASGWADRMLEADGSASMSGAGAFAASHAREFALESGEGGADLAGANEIPANGIPASGIPAAAIPAAAIPATSAPALVIPSLQRRGRAAVAIQPPPPPPNLTFEDLAPADVQRAHALFSPALDRRPVYNGASSASSSTSSEEETSSAEGTSRSAGSESEGSESDGGTAPAPRRLQGRGWDAVMDMLDEDERSQIPASSVPVSSGAVGPANEVMAQLMAQFRADDLTALSTQAHLEEELGLNLGQGRVAWTGQVPADYETAAPVIALQSQADSILAPKADIEAGQWDLGPADPVAASWLDESKLERLSSMQVLSDLQSYATEYRMGDQRLSVLLERLNHELVPGARLSGLDGSSIGDHEPMFANDAGVALRQIGEGARLLTSDAPSAADTDAAVKGLQLARESLTAHAPEFAQAQALQQALSGELSRLEGLMSGVKSAAGRTEAGQD